ncbi:uncharacterized protein BKA78DRAFT_310790 [Phyllosticta capitalensis]|uniref:uncharacterized protein n=1 Tax=Phyllosticta capitalensis TaxID=121624 RepID=UPI00312D4A9B
MHQTDRLHYLLEISSILIHWRLRRRRNVPMETKLQEGRQKADKCARSSAVRQTSQTSSMRR